MYPKTRAGIPPSGLSLSFPAGRHDDQVDALGLVGQLLDVMVPGQAPQPPAPPKIDTGYRTHSFADPLNDWVAW